MCFATYERSCHANTAAPTNMPFVELARSDTDQRAQVEADVPAS